MRQTLREVAAELARVDVELLGEQPQIVRRRDRPVEPRARRLLAPLTRVHLRQPERAWEERALLLDAVVLSVPAQQPSDTELLGDRVRRSHHPVVVVRAEVDTRDQQQRGVERARAELAHEYAALVVVSVAVDRLADLLTHPFPAIRRRAARGRLGKLERAIDGRPAHHFRVHEVSRFAADLPDPPIGLGPALARGVDHLDDELPIVVVGRTAALVPAPCEVHGFPVHVELLLAPRAVADPNRRTTAVTLEVLEL